MSCELGVLSFNTNTTQYFEQYNQKFANIVDAYMNWFKIKDVSNN